MKLKKEQAIEIANLMRQRLKIQNEIEIGDFVGKAPDIDFYPDYNLYYDPNRYEIHLGIYGIVDMIKGMLDQTSNTGLTENEEDTDTGSANSTFPTSDLEITVDDETYDKLVEKSKQSDDGSGLIIKREHPKEQSEDGSDKESNENSNDKSRDSKENPSGTSAAKDGKNPDNSGKSMPGEPERGKKERAKDESKDGTEKKDGNQQDKGAEDPQKSNPSDKGIKKGEKIHGKNTEQGYDKDGVLQREKAGSLIEGENTAEEEMRIDEIKKAMLEAAESTNELARKQIDNINRAEAHARKTVGPVVQNNDPVVTAEDVKGICPDFKEMKRVYKLKDKLPPVLAAMGRTLYRKNKRYFKSFVNMEQSYQVREKSFVPLFTEVLGHIQDR